MSTIGSMIDTQKAQEMRVLVAQTDPNQTAVHNHDFGSGKGRLSCACGVQILPATKPGERDILITKPSTAPNPPRKLTQADAIEVDPESEALIEVACVDCKSPMLLDPQVPQGVDPEAPRVPVCSDCAKARVRHAAMSEQRNVEVIKRTRTAKHQPRTSDGIDHPVTTTTKETRMTINEINEATGNPICMCGEDCIAGGANSMTQTPRGLVLLHDACIEAHNAQARKAIEKEARKAAKKAAKAEAAKAEQTHTEEKEKGMDMDNLSDAELGALVRQQMKATLAEQVVAAKPEVEAQRAQHEAEQVAGIAEARKSRVVLPGFTVGTTLEIPDLDLSDVPSMDEAPDAKTRSPYNKARFRLTKESPLDPEETTYAVLVTEHERLREAAEAHNAQAAKDKPKAAKPKKDKAEVEVQVAVMDADEKAVLKRKVKALMEVTGMSKKEAKAVVLSM